MVGQTTAVRPYPRAAESGARAKFNLCEIPYTYTPYLSLSPTMSPTRGARALCGKTTQKKTEDSCFDLRRR